jgi:hypothetical protein
MWTIQDPVWFWLIVRCELFRIQFDSDLSAGVNRSGSSLILTHLPMWTVQDLVWFWLIFQYELFRIQFHSDVLSDEDSSGSSLILNYSPMWTVHDPVWFSLIVRCKLFRIQFDSDLSSDVNCSGSSLMLLTIVGSVITITSQRDQNFRRKFERWLSIGYKLDHIKGFSEGGGSWITTTKTSVKFSAYIDDNPISLHKFGDESDNYNLFPPYHLFLWLYFVQYTSLNVFPFWVVN